MIKLVAFDLDGTIGNTLPMCIQAFKKATQPYIGHELSDEEMVHTFGLNEKGMIGCVVDEPYRQQALNDFYVIYKELHQEMCPTPFEGIRELIALLKQKGYHRGLSPEGINICDITFAKQVFILNCFKVISQLFIPFPVISATMIPFCFNKAINSRIPSKGVGHIS